MLSMNMKIVRRWIPTGENKVADMCSRKLFFNETLGHKVRGFRLLKVGPKWLNVLKYT